MADCVEQTKRKRSLHPDTGENEGASRGTSVSDFSNQLD